jgi:hypothetical protein
MPTVLAAKLAERIRKEAGIRVHTLIHRTRAGHWQRSFGAWSWWMECRDTPYTVGSKWSATECLHAAKWELDKQWGHVEISLLSEIAKKGEDTHG